MTRRDESSAELHSPEELLATAEALLALADPQMYRAAVVEAITSLETYVARTVFERLKHTMDPLLVAWLEDKTRMDFDARLSILTPVATGQTVDKQSGLWNDYKTAKGIRNGVTHRGTRVSHDRAMFVVRTVRHWMAYIGSTAELTVTLDGLKRYVETADIAVRSARDAEDIVARYFAKAPRDMVVHRNVRNQGQALDFVLRFADQTVAVDVKAISSESGDLEPRIRRYAERFAQAVRAGDFSRGALVVFVGSSPPAAYEVARVVEDGDLSVVVVHAPGLEWGER